MNEERRFCPFTRTGHFEQVCQQSCPIWTGGSGGSCGLAKVVPTILEIEKRLYDIHRDLQGGLTDIRRELEGR